VSLHWSSWSSGCHRVSLAIDFPFLFILFVLILGFILGSCFINFNILGTWVVEPFIAVGLCKHLSSSYLSRWTMQILWCVWLIHWLYFSIVAVILWLDFSIVAVILWLQHRGFWTSASWLLSWTFGILALCPCHSCPCHSCFEFCSLSWSLIFILHSFVHIIFLFLCFCDLVFNFLVFCLLTWSSSFLFFVFWLGLHGLVFCLLTWSSWNKYNFEFLGVFGVYVFSCFFFFLSFWRFSSSSFGFHCAFELTEFF